LPLSIDSYYVLRLRYIQAKPGRNVVDNAVYSNKFGQIKNKAGHGTIELGGRELQYYSGAGEVS